MRITLYFYKTPMGVLERNEKGYVYTSYIENEQMLRERRLMSDSEYSLWGSYKRGSKLLFPEFERIIEQCSRQDIVQNAEINSDDSKWDKLIKLSRLQWYPRGFYVQQTTDMEAERDYHLMPRENVTGNLQADDGGW